MNPCSIINMKEARKIQGLFFNNLKTNPDIKSFINNDLTNYFYNEYGRELSDEELAFVAEILESAGSTYIGIVRELKRTKEKNSIFDLSTIEKLHKELSGYSTVVDEDLFNINGLIIKKLESPESKVSTTDKVQVTSDETDINNLSDGTLKQETQIKTFSNINNAVDIDQKLYMGAFGAKNVMETVFRNGIIRKVLINTKDKLYNNNSEYVDKAIKAYKSEIYFDLVNYFNTNYPNILAGHSNQFYINSKITPDYKEVMDKISSFYVNDMKLTNAMLNKWSNYSEKQTKDKLFTYNNFVILNNFDKFLNLYSGKIFKIHAAYTSPITEDYEKQKYFLSVKNNLMTNFITTKEQFDILSEQTALYKLIVKSLPFVNKQGNIDLGKNIQVSRVNYTVAKLLKDVRALNLETFNKDRKDKLQEFDRTNPAKSFKSILEYIMHNSINGTKRDLPANYSESELAVLRTLYLTVFKTDNTIKEVLGETFYNKLKDSGAIDLIGPSLYEISVNTARKTTNTDLDYFDVLIHNFSKIFLNNYVENTYDKDLKTINSFRPDSYTSKAQETMLRNNLRSFANQKIDNAILDKEFEGVNIDLDNGFVTIDTDEEVLRVDLNTGEVSYGKEKLSNKNKPRFNIDYSSDKFLKLVEYHTGINVSSNPDLFSALSSEIDEGKTNNVTIRILSQITAYVLASKKIKNIPGFDNNPIGELDKINFLKQKIQKGANIFDQDTNTISILGMNEQLFSNISAISRGLSLIRGDVSKAVIKTTAGVTMPLHGLIRHIYNVKDFLRSIIKENKGLSNTPIEGNLFALNQDMIKEPVIRTYTQVSEKTKHSSDLYPEEINQSQILYEFYGSLISPKREGDVLKREVLIQTSVFADKNTAYSVPVDMQSPILLKYYSSKKVTTEKKSLLEASIDDLMKTHFYSEHKYYKNIGNRIKQHYAPVITVLVNNLGYSDIESFMTDKGIDYKNINEIEKYNSLMEFFPEKEFRKAFYSVHGNKVPLIQDLGISKNNMGNASLSETLVNHSKYFLNKSFDGSNPTKEYLERMNNKLNSFIDDLEKTGFKLEYKSDRGYEINILKNVAELLGENLKDWNDPNTGYLLLRKGNKINPLIERYFWTYNLIAENFQTLSVGKIHNHPTKGKNKFQKGTKDYNDRVETLKTGMYLKRQLQGTPMDTFAQGLINGIREKTKTVFLTDVDLATFNVYGTTDKMTVTDGASLMTMAQAILQNNSLLDKAVGTNQKTLGLSIDPIFNSYGLMKHCAFAMTNEDLRNSKGCRYDYDRFYQIAYQYPINETKTIGDKVVTITPDLLFDYGGNRINIYGEEKVKDGVKVWVSGLYDEGLYFLDENKHIIKVIDFDYAQKDLTTGKSLSSDYVIKRFNMTTNQEIEPVILSSENLNLYTIWKAFGGENSISIDPEGKYELGDYKYSHSDSSHHALVNLINKVGRYKDLDFKSDLKLKYNLTDQEIELLFPDIAFRAIDKESEKPDQYTIYQPLKDKFIGQFQFSSSQKSGAKSIQNIDEVVTMGNPILSEMSTLSTGVLMDADHHVENSDITEMTQIVQAQEFNGDEHNVSKEAYEALGYLTRIKVSEYIESVSKVKSGDLMGKAELYNKIVKQFVKASKTQTQTLSNQKMIEWVENSLNYNKMIESKAGNDENSKLPASLEDLETLMPFSAQSIYGGFISMLSNMFNKLAIKRKHAGIASVLKPSGAFVQMFDVPIFDENNNIIGTKAVTANIFNSKYKSSIHEVPSTRDEISLNDWVRYKNADKQIVEEYIDTPIKLIEFKSQGKGKDKVSIIYGKPRDLKPAEFKFKLEGKNRFTSIYELDEFIDCLNYTSLINGNKLSKESLNRLQILGGKIGISSNELINYPTEMVQLLKNEVQKVMKQIDNDKKVTIKGKQYNVSESVSIPGEALGPNIYRTKFGLPKDVSVDEVSEEYFFNLLNKNSLPKIDSDYYIRSTNGNHIYVYLDQNTSDFNNKFTDSDKTIENIDGKNWILNEFGEKIYNIGDLNFKKVYDGGKLHDAIIIKSKSELGKVNGLIKQSESNDGNLIDLLEVASVNMSNLIESNKILANELNSSFQVSNEFTAARIPGQGPQSFTPLQIVDYIHTQSNTIMTNHFTSWLKGEDFDVDKGFWLGVTLDSKGKVVGWSNDFDYSSFNNLKLSLRLPMPDSIVRNLDENSEIVLSEEEVMSLFSPISELKVKTLQKIKNIKSFNILSQNQELINNSVEKINNYFGEQLDMTQIEAAVKNKIARAMFTVISSPSMQVHAGTPINMDEVRAAGAKVEEQSNYVMSVNNPSLIAELQYQNMEGKGTIGIGAVGLKVFSAISYWANEKMKTGKIEDVFFYKNYKINGNTSTYVSNANVNFDNKLENKIDENYINNLIIKGLVQEDCK